MLHPPKFVVWLLAFVVVVTAFAIFILPYGGWFRASEENDRPAKTEQRDTNFRDLAAESGITFRMAFLPKEQGENFKSNLYDHGCGLAVGDFDGDGFDDIYFVNQLGQNALFRNKGDGTFEDVTDQAGVGLGDRVCVGATWADYNNDGLQDLFVTSIRGGNVLFKNLGHGKFKDVTKQAGLEHFGHSQTAAFFDYDNDGYLDLLVTNTAKWTDRFDPADRYYEGVSEFVDLARSPVEYNILYHNNGDGTFTNVTEKAGLKGMGWGGDIAVFDYDEDGYLDVLVTNMFGRSQLYHNNRNGTFTEVTKTALGKTTFGAIGSKVFDFNNDGRLDLFIVDMHSDMWTTIEDATYAIKDTKKYDSVLGPLPAASLRAKRVEREFDDMFRIRKDEVIFGNTLFKNLGGGKFKEVSDAANMETWWPWGIATGDFDNDGHEDVFIPSGMGYPQPYWKNYLMMNNGDETFTERSQEEGIEPPVRGKYLEERVANRPATRSSRCAAVADFANDGRLAIVTNNFNDRPYYFRNFFPNKNYIAFRLQGTRSNRDAIGAVVRLYAGKEIMTRQVNPAGGYLSQSSKTLHFGLGDRTQIDRVEIKWPSGTLQNIPAAEIKMNQLIKVEEPAKD